MGWWWFMNDENARYNEIVNHYTQCFEKYGATHKGIDWPDSSDLEKRYGVMLEVARNHENSFSLLDIGCGYGNIIKFISDNKIILSDYMGLDLSEKMILEARKLFPQYKFEYRDIIKNPLGKEIYDFSIMNGVLTEKLNLTFEEMFDFAKKIIKSAFYSTKIGLAFNVMSKNVDWEREDLFHLSIDELTRFLTKEVSRNFVIRNDYGLYEYTCYVYR